MAEHPFFCASHSDYALALLSDSEAKVKAPGQLSPGAEVSGSSSRSEGAMEFSPLKGGLVVVGGNHWGDAVRFAILGNEEPSFSVDAGA